MHLAALLVQSLCNGQGNGAAHAAANDAHFFQALQLGGLAQRAYKIVYALANRKAVQLHGGAAYDLKNNRNGAGLTVITGHGKGNTLAVLKGTNNDKLAGLCLFGNQRGMNDHPGHGGVERRFFGDGKHLTISPFLKRTRKACAF